MPRYFTGRSVSSHTLTQVDARTFADLVKQLIGLPVSLAVTHDEFWRMPKTEQAEVKKVPYLVPCTFPSSPHEGRKTEFAGPCNLVFLDIDDSPETRETSRTLVTSPGALATRLEGLNFAAYQTISSTPEKPRLRVMVEADAIPPERYPDAVREVARRLGLHHVTGESVIVTQPMFRPSIFSDTPDTDHPLIATHFEGKALTVADIRADGLPGTGSSSTLATTGDIIDALANDREPMKDFPEGEVAKALAFISPDCSRAEWIAIAAAIKHQLGEDGEDAFIEWSSKGQKFVSDEDCRKEWITLRETPSNRAPITFRSVVQKAKEAGYKLPIVTAKKETYEELTAWLNFECQDPGIIMTEGVRRIANIPDLPPVMEESLLHTIVTVLKGRFEVKVSLTVLRKDLNKVRSELANPPDREPEHVETPPWARLFVYVTATEQFFQHSTGRKLSPRALDAAYSRRLLPSIADLQRMEMPVNATTLHTPLWTPSEFLLNHVQLPIVDDYCYEPAQPEDTIITFDGRPLVNIYRRTYPKADASREFEAWMIIDRHLRNLFREPEARVTMMDWLAWHVQHPGDKINWAPLIQGGEGNGKSVFTDISAALLGDDNVNIIAKSGMDKGYNGWVMSSQIVSVEEIRISGANRFEVLDSLKPLISNEKIPMVQRYRDERKVRHCANFLLYTNHHDALPVNQGTRRFWYMKSYLQTKEQIVALTEEDPQYFVKLFDMCRHNAPGLRSLFERHKISASFNPKGHAPVTDYLLELAYNTANETTAILNKYVEDETIPTVTHEVLTVEGLREALRRDEQPKASPQHIANVLQEAGYLRLPGRHMIGGNKSTVWHRESCENPVDFLRKRVDNTSVAAEIL